MTPEDWERIKLVFSGALGVPADLRDAYVLKACGERRDLREAVGDLLSAHGEASSTFLEPAGLLFDAPWLFRSGDRAAGRFTVIRPIARGAMGEVYEAHDDRLRLRVALKALRPQLVGDPQTAERFRREVLVTRDISHDGLCRIFDLIEHPIGPGTTLPEGTLIPCLTMQLLEGQSLEDYLKTRRPLRPSEAFPLLIQVAEALDVLHDHGVVHRDLKPSNVMLVQRGESSRAVLTDFGLAKPLDESLFETQSAVQGGAPFFMAPELFKGERPSRASDVYAFGLLADEMVTSRRAYSADSLHGLMLQKLQAGPSKPSERVDGLPPAWEQAILQCLSLAPEERFDRASDVCLALDRRRPSQLRMWLSRLRGAVRPRSRRYAAMAGAALVGLVSAFAVIDPSEPVEQSVVVLPFENLTGDRGSDYLAAGTAAELWHRLSRVVGLRVSAPPREPGERVESRYRATFALTGNVRQSGNELRITVHVSDQQRDRMLWSQTFDGPRDRALTLEDKVASAAAAALSGLADKRRDSPVRALYALIPFVNAQAPQVPTRGTDNSQAFDAYMRGRYLFEVRKLPEALSAVKLLTLATQLDPRFAAPYATLSDVQQVFMDFHHGAHDELLREAERYAEQAVSIDPTLADAQLSLASVRQMQSRWDEAEAGFKKTLELHPKFSRAHRWYGGMLLQFGRNDDCLAEVRTALELDPYDIGAQSFLGLALFYSNRSDEAARHLEQVAERSDSPHVRMILGQVYSQLAGRPGPQQDAYVRKALELAALLRQREIADGKVAADGTPKTEFADFVSALAWSFRGDLAQARPFVERLEAELAVKRTSPSILARIYAVQRRTAEALGALDDSWAEHDRELMYLSVSPLYRSIRNEPRFRELQQRMGLTH